MTQYLLGELSAEEQMEVETEYFADPERFSQLQTIEQDMIEGYVSGKLSVTDRAKFERHFLSSPVRREQAQFFQTLARTIPLETKQSLPAQATTHNAANGSTDLAETASWWQPLLGLFRGPGVAPKFSFAAAALILVLVGAYLTIKTGQLREQLAQTERERFALQQREQELKRQIDAQRERNDQLSQELEKIRQRLEALPSPQAQSMPAMASFTWILSGLRETNPDRGSLRKMVIPPGVDLVQLTFQLPTARYNRYRISLHTLTGEELWSSGEIKARPVKSDAAVAFRAPAKPFLKGTYSLALSGRRPSGEWVTIGEFPIEVDLR